MIVRSTSLSRGITVGMAALLVLSPARAFCRGTAGTLKGVVLDSSGGVLPGVNPSAILRAGVAP